MAETLTTPVDLFTEAAAKLRRLAEHATTGPWYEDGVDGVYAYGAPDEGCPNVFTDRSCSYDDIQWIAALGPVVAEPLAALLDDAAEAARAGNYPGFYHRAKAIALHVVGRHDEASEAVASNG